MRTRQLDLACYDNKDFYQKFILATQDADKCIDCYLEKLTLYSGMAVQLALIVEFSLRINAAILPLLLLLLPAELIAVGKENEKSVAARMERVAYEQKREYQNRVFYLADYARDLRLNPGMNEKCRQDFRDCNEKIREVNQKYGKSLFFYSSLRRVLLEDICGNGAILTFLLFQTLVLHSLSFARMVTCITCASRLQADAADLILGWKGVAENAAYVAQIRKLLAMEPVVVTRDGLDVSDVPSELSIEHVSFSYVEGRSVLRDISLTIRPGQKIALVGYNGSGKTTLVKLLLRLYDPTEGQICLGGVDIRSFDVEQYRFSIGSVFQDFKIYAASLKENVLLDVGEDTQKEKYGIEKALYDAHFTLRDHRLIYQIETPLTTEFEKDGVNLSGGEAQKVAIARTLYRRQNLIIMDEPSSALDPLSEYLLNQELNEIAKHNTVIFISHRLSTTRDADCIYMMDQGRIIESGTHEELLAQNGKYADMWRVQAGLYQER